MIHIIVCTCTSFIFIGISLCNYTTICLPFTVKVHLNSLPFLLLCLSQHSLFSYISFSELSHMYKSRRGIARSKDMNVFYFSRYCQTAFQNGCTNLHFYLQLSLLVAHIFTNICIFYLFNLAFLVGM